VDTLAGQLETKAALELKYLRQAELVVEKKQECQKEVLLIKEKLQTIAVQTRQLQKNVRNYSFLLFIFFIL
jgi:hypothetical protein